LRALKCQFVSLGVPVTQAVLNSHIRNKQTNLVSIICAIAAVVAASSLLFWLFLQAKYGFDFTDEGFYIAWIADPFAYKASFSQFGFVYHPLYKLLGGSLVYLRQANLICTFILSFFFANQFFKCSAFDTTLERAPWYRLAAAYSFAIVSMAFCQTWLLTPSYNSLALQGLLITFSGLIALENPRSISRIGPILLISVGGWLCFMGKPSTAAVLSALIAVYLAISRRLNVSQVCVTAVSALMLLTLSALVIDGSVVEFASRLQLGIGYVTSLKGGHSSSALLRMDVFQLSSRGKLWLLSFTGAIAVVLALVQTNNPKYWGFSAVCTLLTAVITIFISSQALIPALRFGQFQGLLFLSIPAAICLANVWRIRKKPSFKFSIRYQLAFLLSVTPHMYAFGTNGNYWEAASDAGIFWVFAGLLLSPTIFRSRIQWIFSLAVAAQLIVAILLSTAMDAPYRQPESIRSNNYSLPQVARAKDLVFSTSYGKYVEEVYVAAKKNGLKLNSPVIDLTGQSPGLIYLLGATNVGQAWIIGGYKGSNETAASVLQNVRCTTLSSAWLITEPDGPRNISDEALGAVGLHISKNYEEIYSWKTPLGSGGYVEQRTQHLLKPLQSEKNITKDCLQ